jgi:hypothetical protein
MFVMGSKKLIFFDNVANRNIKKQMEQEVYACDVIYSDIFDVMIVFTKIDTRFYDGKTGQLKMVESAICSQTKCKELVGCSKKLLTLVEKRL